MFLPLLLLAAMQDNGAGTDDYIESATAIRLTIGADGKAKDCIVTQSSGAPELDAKVCPIMLARAHFKPKLDAEGKPIESYFSTAIKWRLPKEAAKP